MSASAIESGPAEGSPTPSPLPRVLRWPFTATERLDAWLIARPRFAWGLCAGILAVVAILVVVPKATAPGGISPLDEYVYTDAVFKADRGQLTNRGDKTDEYARQVTICRGTLTWFEPDPNACGTPRPDAITPLGGYTAADIHPPTYFFATAWVAKVIRAVGLTNDILISARLAGALWLWLGLMSMVLLGRSWGATWVMPIVTAAAVGLSPLALSTSAYLTPDALGILVGSWVMLATTRWLRGRLPIALLGLAALAPAFVKVPFVLAPLFGAVLLACAAVAGQVRWRRALLGGAVLVVGAGLGAVLWQQIRMALSVADPVANPDGPPPTFREFAVTFGYYFDWIPNSPGFGLVLPAALTIGAGVLMWLLRAASLGGILLRRRPDPLVAVCWASVAGMLFGAIVLALIVFGASGGGFLVPAPRYGIALLPLYAVPLMCTRHPLAFFGLAATSITTLGMVAWQW